jgi:hypothetical protein
MVDDNDDEKSILDWANDLPEAGLGGLINSFVTYFKMSMMNRLTTFFLFFYLA